jgi:hypothetical protein
MNNSFKKIALAFSLFLCIFLTSSCSTTQSSNRYSYISLQNQSGKPIKRLVVIVAGKESDFPSEAVENALIERLTYKGYEVVGRGVTLRNVIAEDILNGKLKHHLHINLSGSDAIFLLEVTAWSTTMQNGTKMVSSLALSGKLVDNETAKIIWIKNSYLPPITIFNLFRSLGGLFIGQENPINNVLTEITDAFPPQMLNSNLGF